MLELAPSEFLTANELAAAALADQGETFNPQQQNPVTWPVHPTIARAYVDQLVRSGGLTADAGAEVMAALDQAEAGTASPDALRALATGLTVTGDDTTTQRRAAALRDTLSGLAVAGR